MPWWSDIYRLWDYVSRQDPYSKKKSIKEPEGVAITQRDIMPYIRDNFNGDRGSIPVQGTLSSNDWIDLSTVQNRTNRYKEYEKIKYSTAEVNTAVTIFADEACVSGNTNVITPFGPIPIKYLAEHKAEERFLVYCFDPFKKDYTLGWAHHPRFVKEAPTVRVLLDDGSDFICTEDHKILLRTMEWAEAGKLKSGDELMPFYRLKANQNLTKLKYKQFPRIFTLNEGWKHERQFLDDWKLGERDPKYDERITRATKLLMEGCKYNELAYFMKTSIDNIRYAFTKEGFSLPEMVHLAKKRDRRKVIDVHPHKTIPVYDLSVDEYENFATDNVIMHNCQIGDNKHVIDISCKNQEVLKEAEFFLYRILKVDKRAWNDCNELFTYGDRFYELIIDPDNPKNGVIAMKSLPPASMYRVETVKGRLLEYQQSNEGPDLNALTKGDPTKLSDQDLATSTATRFRPEQIVHMRVGEERSTFYPYGVSLIEPARGPAHQLRLMEDAMLVYRLSRAPERRVFYIDVGQLASNRAEAFIERMKEQFRKRKVYNERKGGPGASGIEERWHVPSQDEDYWIPVRQGANTRIETLPGAQNLGETGDVDWFRKKVLVALNFPLTYLNQEDTQQSKLSLSSQDYHFAVYVERLQKSYTEGLHQALETHLRLMGFPPDLYEDLEIVMTPPSDYRQLSKAEVEEGKVNRAIALKGAMLFDDYTLLTDYLDIKPDKAKEIIGRLKLQKLEELKLSIMAQNPQVLGIGLPGDDAVEIGAQAGGANPMLAPTEDQNQQQNQSQQPALPPPTENQEQPPQLEPQGEEAEGQPLPNPSDDDIKKYDMEIKSYASEMDEEEVDETDVE